MSADPPADPKLPPEPTGPPAPAGGDPAPSGPDLARAALARAKAAARERGNAPNRRPAVRKADADRRSGSGPDARDPELVGSALRRVLADRGWDTPTTSASVLARWEALVGAEVADHCRPVSLVDGALVLVAESSAWATQLRLLTRTLQARLTAQLGDGVVTSVLVKGPERPDWRKGPLRVSGPGARGPRDTYG